MLRRSLCPLVPIFTLILLGSLSATSAGSEPFVYVLDTLEDEIFIIDAETNQVVNSLPADENASDIIASRDGTRVFVANIDSRDITIIDTATQSVVETVPVEIRPSPIAISPDGALLYASVLFNGLFRVFDTETFEVVQAATLLPNGTEIVFSPSGDRFYLAIDPAGEDPPGVYVYDTETLTEIGFAPTVFGALGMELTPDGSRAFVAAVDEVFVFDTGTLDSTSLFEGDELFRDVALEPNGSRAYFTSPNDTGALRVVDQTTLEVLPSITLPVGSPWRMAITEDGSRLFVTDISNDQVLVVDIETQSLLTSIPVGTSPSRIVIPPAPAPPPPPTLPVIEIPTLGSVGLWLLALLVAGFGTARLRGM